MDMKVRIFGCYLCEGFKSLGRNGWMIFVFVSVVIVMFLFVGVFFMLMMNLNYIVKLIENDVEICVYVDVVVIVDDWKVMKEKLDVIK